MLSVSVNVLVFVLLGVLLPVILTCCFLKCIIFLAGVLKKLFCGGDFVLSLFVYF